MGLITLVAQPVFILLAKLRKGGMKSKSVIFLPWTPSFSKCTFSRLQHFILPCTDPVNPIFSVLV